MADKNEKTEIVGGKPMTPAEAEQNRRQVEAEQKEVEQRQQKERNVPPDSDINKKVEGPSNPETVRSAKMYEKESGESKSKRVDTADVDPAGEKAPQGWGKKPTVYVMTNVDGEKLSVTTLQWKKYGQRLRAKGWTTPEFAEGDQGGNEEIPQDVVWGKDKPAESAY